MAGVKCTVQNAASKKSSRNKNHVGPPWISPLLRCPSLHHFLSFRLSRFLTLTLTGTFTHCHFHSYSHSHSRSRSCSCSHSHSHSHSHHTPPLGRSSDRIWSETGRPTFPELGLRSNNAAGPPAGLCRCFLCWEVDQRGFHVFCGCAESSAGHCRMKAFGKDIVQERLGANQLLPSTLIGVLTMIKLWGW